ncbi:MAG: hypothetical protein IT440_07730 [Phycisphaeraceae bacterium]|nr:hypothetical protein [Phycisphaeraceae bacterium]
MSQLPPPVDAGEPWSGSPDQEPSSPHHADHRLSRSVVFLWIIGGLEVVFCGFLSLMSLIIYATVSIEQFQSILKDNPEAVEAIRPHYPNIMVWVFWAMLFLGVAPGLILLGMGFALRKGLNWAVSVSLLLLVTQSLVLALYLLVSIIQALMMGSPAALTANVLLYGSPMLVLLAGIQALWRTRQSRSDIRSIHCDPWNASPQ